MLAAVLYGNNDLRLEKVPVPELSAHEVLIKVAYNGLCGTDATEFTKGPMMVPLDKPHPNSKHFGPTILGHEFVGQIVDAGANARESIGKRVACGAGVSCGQCAMCLANRTNLCEKYFTLGLSAHGGLAEYVKAPKDICIPIPEKCSDKSATLAQPLAVANHAVRRARISEGDQVVLLGVGAIGAFVCLALQNYNVHVTAVDIDESRLAVATKLGADRTMLIEPSTSTDELIKIYDTKADVVFETSGIKGAPERALDLVRDGGTLLLLGLNNSAQEFPFSRAVLREVSLETSAAHVCSQDIPAALKILEDEKIGNLLIERTLPLERVVEAFNALSSGSARGKILISPFSL